MFILKKSYLPHRCIGHNIRQEALLLELAAEVVT